MSSSRLLAVIFIFACTCAAWLVLGSSVHHRSGEADQRLAQEVSRLAPAVEDGDSLRVLEKPAEAPGAGAELVGRPDAVSADDAALAQRIAALEGQVQALSEQVSELVKSSSAAELKALSDEELQSRASSLWAFKNYADALEAYEALLAREPDLDLETRSEILSAMAQCHRALGEPDDADAIFKQVEALHGEGTAGAMTARYQRAWVRFAKGDIEGAREFMREVARTESSPSFWRLFSRANAADFSIRMGDTAHVQQDLEDFRVELQEDGSETANRVLGYVDRLLDQLEE